MIFSGVSCISGIFWSSRYVSNVGVVSFIGLVIFSGTTILYPLPSGLIITTPTPGTVLKSPVADAAAFTFALASAVLTILSVIGELATAFVIACCVVESSSSYDLPDEKETTSRRYCRASDLS